MSERRSRQCGRASVVRSAAGANVTWAASSNAKLAANQHRGRVRPSGRHSRTVSGFRFGAVMPSQAARPATRRPAPPRHPGRFAGVFISLRELAAIVAAVRFEHTGLLWAAWRCVVDGRRFLATTLLLRNRARSVVDLEVLDRQ